MSNKYSAVFCLVKDRIFSILSPQRSLALHLSHPSAKRKQNLNGFIRLKCEKDFFQDLFISFIFISLVLFYFILFYFFSSLSCPQQMSASG